MSRSETIDRNALVRLNRALLPHIHYITLYYWWVMARGKGAENNLVVNCLLATRLARGFVHSRTIIIFRITMPRLALPLAIPQFIYNTEPTLVPGGGAEIIPLANPSWFANNGCSPSFSSVSSIIHDLCLLTVYFM